MLFCVARIFVCSSLCFFIISCVLFIFLWTCHSQHPHGLERSNSGVSSIDYTRQGDSYVCSLCGKVISLRGGFICKSLFPRLLVAVVYKFFTYLIVGQIPTGPLVHSLVVDEGK